MTYLVLIWTSMESKLSTRLKKLSIQFVKITQNMNQHSVAVKDFMSYLAQQI
jgi:hypothetical protein